MVQNLFAARRLWRRATPLIAALTLLSACAAGLPKEEQAVVDRSQARWDAIVAGDLEQAYTYYTPGFRSSKSLIDYGVEMRLRRVNWTSAEYLDHACEGDRCAVRFRIGIKVVAPVPGLRVWNTYSVVEDTWIRTRGEWWYLPEN